MKTKSAYRLSARQRADRPVYKGHGLIINGQYCTIYSDHKCQQAVWEVLGEFAEAMVAINGFKRV